jgi:hypothetical protein
MAKLGLMALLNLDITRFENNMKKASKQTDMMGTAMKSLGGFVAGAFSIAAIGAFVKSSMQAYQQQIEAETRLTDALSGREDVMKRLSEDASNLQQTTLFADDQIVQAQALFATMGLGEDAIRKLTPLVIDLAARYGKELPEAVDMVKSALNGSGKAMKQYGFELEGAAGSGDRFNSIIDQLNTKVGGQAEALGKLDINAPKRLAVAWDEFSEMMGGLIAGPLARVLDYFTKDLPAAFEYIGNGFKVIKQGKDTIDAIAEGMNDYARADETTRKSMVDGWKEMLEVFKQNYKQALLTEGTNSRNAKYYQKQISDLSTLITKVDEYTASQSNAVRVDEEAIEAANKLAEARLKASQAKDKEFISSIGYKDKTPKADFDKNTTDQAIMGELDKAIEASREIPEIINRSTVNMQALTAVSGQQITIWQQLGEAIQEALEKSVNFEDVFMQMVNSNIKGVEEMGKAMWNMARQIVAAELAKTIGAAVSSAMESVPFPFNILAAGAAAAAAGTLFNNVVPQLAGGGIATAPTLAMVGEYPGARSNPEVIAPLDKLSAMLGGSNTVNVRGRLSGADILISSERYDKLRTRLRGF